MLVWGAYLLCIGLTSIWIAVFVLSKHLPHLRSTTRVLPHPARHSLTETIFENVGAYSNKLGTTIGHYGSVTLLALLGKFLPWFKSITHSAVLKLEQFNNMIKGRLDLKRNRDNASPFIRDIRNNADIQENGKIEG